MWRDTHTQHLWGQIKVTFPPDRCNYLKQILRHNNNLSLGACSTLWLMSTDNLTWFDSSDCQCLIRTASGVREPGDVKALNFAVQKDSEWATNNTAVYFLYFVAIWLQDSNSWEEMEWCWNRSSWQTIQSRLTAYVSSSTDHHICQLERENCFCLRRGNQGTEQNLCPNIARQQAYSKTTAYRWPKKLHKQS